jgi:hypothetical protein
MSGGEISGNEAANDGGGVANWAGTFTMSGGEISGNTAQEGGGVRIGPSATFTKTNIGGVIYGYIAGDPKSNKAGYENIVQSNAGHAVFVVNGAKGNPQRNDTVAANEALSYKGAENEADATISGKWD